MKIKFIKFEEFIINAEEIKYITTISDEKIKIITKQKCDDKELSFTISYPSRTCRDNAFDVLAIDIDAFEVSFMGFKSSIIKCFNNLRWKLSEENTGLKDLTKEIKNLNSILRKKKIIEEHTD